MKNILLTSKAVYISILSTGLIVTSFILVKQDALALDNPSEAWKLSQGGKIYDNWAKALNVTAPDKTHPSYPSAGKKQGATTWRCKECHGWDYNGRDGAYKSGSHFSGVKGIRNTSGKAVNIIKKIIRNKTHGYSKTMINDDGLDNLALFVSRGQLDMSKYIDVNSKKVKGSVQRGAQFFQTICAVCHGYDGKKINFHESRKIPEYVGTVANKNPWEVLHKIRNGQPNAAMISLRTLNTQDQVDIVAFTRTLPTR
ncbi:hypothetical protein MNBD_GAMMA22-2663 [hydrothermal vent metagenome]|uniref:Cytochrome c domain-containing protein n=1 Tax=hydrothermal vent metagenome TaxID=652676 RepID=A0A3B0ZUU6_9ZZZZ